MILEYHKWKKNFIIKENCFYTLKREKIKLNKTGQLKDKVNKRSGLYNFTIKLYQICMLV